MKSIEQPSEFIVETTKVVFVNLALILVEHYPMEVLPWIESLVAGISTV